MKVNHIPQSVWPKGQVDSGWPLLSCMEELLPHDLLEIADGLHCNAILEVSIDPQKGIITITLESFEGHAYPQNPPKLYPLAGGVVAHPFDALARSARPHVGRWGPFPPVVAMVVAVVTPVVSVLRLLKNAIKTLKLVACKQCLYLLLSPY
jgi:hypothetical protein